MNQGDDIIAQKNKVLHFIEVKFLDVYSFENLEYSINRKYMRNMVNTALEYTMSKFKSFGVFF
ncbi:Endonuclease [Borrelia nietonii YOR]|uniref:Endonuclease n=1 Tax=Borrelia nietonii YOR TaxID=1293576 RepID=A0ABM7DWB2_9SPIR|nr:MULTISPECIES: YraN family protein [Borrelia]AHH03699.1 Endonuclease [Borrelia nietonii YOR]AHH14196.1 hypothetical protein BHW_0900086 [Borrelia hermsii MTW]UPA09383.1 YraN family protein [Borrelia nietonii YOR]